HPFRLTGLRGRSPPPAPLGACWGGGPFLVPQTHLGSRGVFAGLSAFMLALVALGLPANALTVACAARFGKLRSPLNRVLVNMAGANLLVVCAGSTTACYCFSRAYFALGPVACKVEGFAATLWAIFKGAGGGGTFPPALLGPVPWPPPPVMSHPRAVDLDASGAVGQGGPSSPPWGGRGPSSPMHGAGWGAIALSAGRLMHRSPPPNAAQVAAQQKESESTQKAEKEVSRMVMVMILAFCFCWGPYTCFACFAAANPGYAFHPLAAALPAYFAKSATIYNPIIYVFMNRQVGAGSPPARGGRDGGRGAGTWDVGRGTQS
uniref:G-protein coupled receptors family 1 profile domain-containing protein n=1 Tax=Apteryx owenii TaxID=8824 RepID=A0A8B9P787_APTOW